jgi:hypothetical protein
MKSQSKKLAVCLYGRFGNRFNDDAGSDGLAYLKNEVLKGVEADFFVYSYDQAHQEEIESALGEDLVASHFGTAPNHVEDFLAIGGDPNLFKPDDPSRTIGGTFSFCAQRDGALSLMLSHSRDGTDEYSHVLVCRIDLGQIDQYNQRHPQRVSEVPRLANFTFSNPQVAHAAWNQLNAGVPDQWFILDIASAKKLSGSLSRFMKYLLPGSEYLTSCESGIPWSSKLQEFSNEQTRLQPSGDLISRPSAKALDNHLLHKFDFIKMGLFHDMAPSFDSKGIVQLCYTHSSYLDGWVLSSRQQRIHLGSFSKEYLAIEDSSEGRTSSSPPGISKVFYDDKLSYTERLLQVLETLEEEFVFFTHEDMPLIRTPVTNSIIEAKCLLESRPENAVVRFIRVGRGLRLNLDRPSRWPYFAAVQKWSRWKFSIQPSLWKRSSLIKLLRECPKLNVWEFEVRGQREFSKLGFRSFQPLSSGGRRGRHHFDSALFPYVATAIVKGRWNLLEYPELSVMLKSVDLDNYPHRESLLDI